MADTPHAAHAAHAQGEQDAAAARARAQRDGTDGAEDSAVLTVFQIAEFIPAAYRQAYLDGAARVLGAEASHQSTTSRLV